MSEKRSEIIEAILGLVLGIPALFIGLALIARTCNLFFPTSMSSIGCNESSSNFLGIVGLIVASIGGIALVASIAVLIGRRKSRS